MVICGDRRRKLPNVRNANLVGHYIDALKIFLANNGSIVFWNGNEPFIYKSKIFLERAEFPGEVSKTKVCFGGEHEGKSFMILGDISVNIEKDSKNDKFNLKRIFSDGKYSMFSLRHNLVRIAEGTTFSFAQDTESIAPFNIFGYALGKIFYPTLYSKIYKKK